MDHIGQRGEPAQARPLDATVNRRLIECRREFLLFFRRRLGRPEDAEDALQDFCLKVIRAAAKPDSDEKIDAWLGRILRNTLIDHYRRHAAWRRAEAAYGREMDGAVLDFEVEPGEGPCCGIHDVLPTLRPDYAEILRRADLNEEPRERIAAELGLTTNNVGVRLHRARRALKEKLEKIRPTCRDGGFRSGDGAPPGETALRFGDAPTAPNAVPVDRGRERISPLQGSPVRPIQAPD